ncbi:Wzz/FepE/Etk N-terminal domain-containing protein [Marinagarivorans algicola]|uniref:Wzz/FepE/Etk N-terminal domain-containing protein n=1 Tax=Marinagarivorans algicola TaxID=1513270 RepID=UPI0012E30B75|nr:Wzz/FepE/Etk N-terminal domain-containing protein [Marinagarivorans algicola]
MPDNKDLNQRFDQLEKRLESMAVASVLPPFDGSNTRADEIDLRELFGVLWEGKWWIIAITFLFAVAGVVYALSLPNMYKSEGIYAPAQKESTGGGMAGQFGGLAAMAGVSLGGGESNDIEQAIALISSWPFLEGFIERHQLKPFIMGVKSWSYSSGEIQWNTEVYNPTTNTWVLDTIPAEPTSYETFKQFSRMLSISQDSTTGLLNISLEYYIPDLSQKWIELLVQDINTYFQQRDINEARKGIEFLEARIEGTSISEMHSVFYKMIESQTKTLMLAKVNEQYLIQTVVPPKAAEIKSKPSRLLLCIVFTLLGGIISVVILLSRYFIK